MNAVGRGSDKGPDKPPGGATPPSMHALEGLFEVAALQRRRYTAQPFPAYRHLPGITPHPLTHPEGHGGAMPARAGTPEACLENFLFGCDLYNHGYWWEAHEAWEMVWHAVNREGPRALMLQAMIQAANTHLKLRMDRRNAVCRLHGAVADLLSRIGEQPDGRCLGIATDGWGRALDTYLFARLDREALHHELTGFPYLEPGPLDVGVFRPLTKL